MVAMRNQFSEVNVLASEAGWEWPYALREIFLPRGVNLLVAEGVEEFVDIMGRRRIHATIVDVDSKKPSGLAMVKIMRMDYPLIPCILLGSDVGEEILGKALELEVFSVIGKPVDMGILREQLNRLFLKKYNSCIFS
jgi:DNA-binding NtrC family response regulator